MQKYANPGKNETEPVNFGIFGGSAGPSIYQQITSYRDNGTHADEWLKLFVVLIGISSIFTLGFGWALHFQIFQPYLGEYAAHFTAALFTAFIEVAKLVIGYKVLRHLVFGIFTQSKTDFALGLFGALIFVAAFWWSYYNSTHGVQYATQIVSEWRIDRQKVDTGKQTAPIDGRIAETKKTASEGLGIKWKGTTTRGGQAIAKNSTAALSSQERQKTILLEMAAKEQDRNDKSRDHFIKGSSNLFALLGGKMEFFQALLLLGMVCCSKILYDRIKARQGAQPNPTSQNQFSPHNNYNNNGSNTGNYRPIGFNTNMYGNVNPVTQQSQSVTQQNAQNTVVGANQAFKHFLTRLQRDVPNFNNKSAKPESVAARLVKVLDEASEFPALPSLPILRDFISYTVVDVIAGMQSNNQLDTIPKSTRDWIENTWHYVMQQESTPTTA